MWQNWASNQPPPRRKKSVLETMWDVVRRLVDDAPWKNEADKIKAHGIINRNDPNYVPPVQSFDPQHSLTPEQQTIAQLQRELALARGQANVPQSAAQQMQAAYPVQAMPGSPAAAQTDQMRGYAYPVPQPQGGPVQQAYPQPQQPFTAPVSGQAANPEQMTQYVYPSPQTEYQPVQPF